tara:strand:- start:489 stop:665 length:177 start_codon:yes stop_codon:yes gene_type:complete
MSSDYWDAIKMFNNRMLSISSGWGWVSLILTLSPFVITKTIDWIMYEEPKEEDRSNKR